MKWRDVASHVDLHSLVLLPSQDAKVLHAWLSELHFEEYYPLFTQAAYDMPTISRMTPEVSALMAHLCTHMTSGVSAFTWHLE